MALPAVHADLPGGWQITISGAAENIAVQGHKFRTRTLTTYLETGRNHLSASRVYIPYQQPVWNHVFTWLLLGPLLYLAVYGAFSIDHAEFNNAVAGEYGTLLAGRSKLVPMAEIGICYGIIGVVCFLHFRSLSNLCLKFPSLLALPILAVASTAWSQDPARSFLLGTLSLAATVFAFYLFTRFSPEQQLQLFLFVGFAVLSISIVLAAFFPSIGVMQLDGKGAWQGLFNHKNRCAMGMAFLLAPALFLRAPLAKSKVMKWVYIILSLFLIAMTQSRTGWIIALLLLLAVPVINLFTRIAGREKLLVTVGFGAIVILLVLVLAQNYGAIAIALGKDPTLTGRLTIWRALVTPISKSPLLGFGYSAFWLGFKGEAMNVALATGFRNLANAENGILQMWLELGLVGVLIFLYTLFEACKNAVTCLRLGAPTYIKWYSAIIFLELLALVDGGKFMFPNSIDWVLYVLACLGVATQARLLKASRIYATPSSPTW
jgi:exopolysaccharide production protein ExoQ